jgi:hypothetical protein
MPLTVLFDGHRELLRLMNDVIDAAGHAGATSEIAQARRTMAQATARHLAKKNLLVIAPLSQSPCPRHRELARRLTDEILATRQATIEHYGVWTLAAIEADPREFRMTVRGILRSLEKRFQYEQDTVYPQVIAAMQAVAAQRAA